MAGGATPLHQGGGQGACLGRVPLVGSYGDASEGAVDVQRGQTETPLPRPLRHAHGLHLALRHDVEAAREPV